MMKDLEDFTIPAVGLSMYAAGWVVTHTALPDRWQGYVAAGLVLVGGLAAYAVLRALGLEVTGGRCRAATNDGTRCRLNRDAGADLCHVHQRTHDVELHASAVDAPVSPVDTD